MVQFLMKLLLKQRFLAVHHDFHFVLPAKFHFLYVKESEMWKGWSRKFWKVQVGNFGKGGVGVGYFTSDSATLLISSTLFSELQEIKVNKDIFVGFRGSIALITPP